MRVDLSGRVTVATHGCPHHLDELVAIALLREVVRKSGGELEVTFLARDEIAEQADRFDFLIDIGNEYDPQRGRFDHHQGGEQVEGKSAAGLLFEAFYRSDARYAYLKPIIDYVDAVDAGLLSRGDAAAEDPRFGRGRRMISISSLLKAVGGFAHDPQRSRRCLELVDTLIASVLRHADIYSRAADELAKAERVGSGVLLDSAEPYGPGLLEYVQDTDLAFVGFPDRPGRFIVTAVREANGKLRIRFPSDLPGATFVHPQGFMVVFPSGEDARRALATVAGASSE